MQNQSQRLAPKIRIIKSSNQYGEEIYSNNQNAVTSYLQNCNIAKPDPEEDFGSFLNSQQESNEHQLCQENIDSHQQHYLISPQLIEEQQVIEPIIQPIPVDYSYNQYLKNMQNFEMHSRYFDDERLGYFQPILKEKKSMQEFQEFNQILNFQKPKITIIQISNQPNIEQPQETEEKKKKRNKKNRKKKLNSQQVEEASEQLILNQYNSQYDKDGIEDQIEAMQTPQTVQIIQQFDDAISDLFLKKIDEFMRRNNGEEYQSITQSFYGKQKKSIAVTEIIGFEEIVDKLCKEYPQVKFSEIAITVKLIVNYQKCCEFLKNYHPSHQERVLRQINELIQNQQQAILSNDQNELLQTQIQITQFQQTIKTSPQIEINKGVSNSLQVVNPSLLETAYQIIESKKYCANSCQNDKNLIQQQKQEFLENRTQLIDVYNQKAELVRQYEKQQLAIKIKQDLLTPQKFEARLQKFKLKKEKLQQRGRELFLNLMVIERNYCKIDFHKFFAAEIEDLLDGVLDQIESYQIYNASEKVRLQIIVGKGKHSIGGKPIIGPITQQYLRNELQQNVEIKEGIIEVIV